MNQEKTFEMYNGVTIPKIGFGTWQIPNDEAFDSVTMALSNGYTHIDTAYVYGNEEAVGRAIKAFDIDRDDLFVTTKLPAEVKTADRVREHFEESRKKLQLDVIDLYLIHAPWPWDKQDQDFTAGNIAVWKVMEELYNEGLIRSIGVSNFSIKDIQALLDSCDIVPMVNQIPYYVGKDQKELLAFCKEHNILVEAYSPLATGKTLNSEPVLKMAEKYGKTPAQICIRYCLDQGTLPLPKSTHEGRIIENFQLDFELEKEDIELLENIEDVRK